MTRNFMITSLALMFALMLFYLPAAAKDDAGKPKGKTGFQMFSYKPPMRGAPGSRMGGGTRGLTGGTSDDLPFLTVLAPSHTGLTTKGSPTLYWHISSPSSKPIEFTLNDEEAGETLIQTHIRADQGGIQQLDLSDYRLNLSLEKEYSWFVTMILDPGRTTEGAFSGGGIRRVKPSASLTEKLKETEKVNIPSVYAMEGIWYDALEALSRQIEASPRDKKLRDQRAGLLEQVGLHEAAKFERSEH